MPPYNVCCILSWWVSLFTIYRSVPLSEPTAHMCCVKVAAYCVSCEAARCVLMEIEGVTHSSCGLLLLHVHSVHSIKLQHVCGTCSWLQRGSGGGCKGRQPEHIVSVLCSQSASVFVACAAGSRDTLEAGGRGGCHAQKHGRHPAHIVSALCSQNANVFVTCAAGCRDTLEAGSRGGCHVKN